MLLLIVMDHKMKRKISLMRLGLLQLLSHLVPIVLGDKRFIEKSTMIGHLYFEHSA